MEPIQADPLIGQLIERRYQVRSHLADGGMGRVYVAHDTRLERDVAFKVLRADLARDPAFVTRFQREARAAARLSHPHVVAVHDQGRDGDVVFLAMELVDGVTMRDVINRGGRPTGELLALFEQVLDGLGAAHHAGLVHRDIKPENILISSRGVVKIADFGLARAVSSARSSVSADNEMLIGTASYLAPEQVEPARFGHSGPRGDVYASALVLAEMLTGRRSFDGDSPVQVAYRHVHEAPHPPSSADASLAPLDAWFTRATSKMPADRPADATASAHELHAARARLTPEALGHPAPPAAHVTAPTAQLDVPAASPEAYRVEGTIAPGAIPATGQDGGRPTGAPTGPQGADEGRNAALRPAHTHVIPATTTQTLGATPAGGPRRRRRWPWVAAAATAIAAGGLALALTVGPLTSTDIPEVNARPQGEAISTLRSAGFDTRVTLADSDSVPAGRVISTSPEQGSSHRRGTDVTLVVSNGPKMVDVPAVAGLQRDKAEAKLKSEGFGHVTHTERHDVREAGTVLSVSPGAGAHIRHDTTVTLVVSSGPEEFHLPDVAKQTQENATTTLQERGLTVTTLEEFSPDVPSGSVIGTDPTSGTQVKTGDTITLRVSKGVEMADVPDVTGMKAAEARSRLEDAGFHVDGASWLDELLSSTVSSQTPSGGSRTPKGSSVTLSF